MHELDLAINYIAEKINEYNLDLPFEQQIYISTKRIQKLLYLSQGIYIKYMGRPMFLEEFYAWPSGPVIPRVYDKYMNVEIQPKKGLLIVPKEMKEVLEHVVECTNLLSTDDLENISKGVDSPWYRFYNPFDPAHLQIIPNDEISNHCAIIDLEKCKIKSFVTNNFTNSYRN